LLYVQTGRPEVRTAGFTLLQQLPAEPMDAFALRELQAVLDAADTSPLAGDDPNLHPRCRFPARYHWLAGVRQQAHWQEPPAFCIKLHRWLAERPAGEFSVLMVSGYVSNPGSTFGHTLIRVAPPAQGNPGAEPSALLDSAFNFGAAVPANESIPLYIARGLFGAYDSAFSVGEYFQHDQVYTHQEMRDIWIYAIDLNPSQRRWAILRLAELAGFRFDYYFLSHNCALRMGQLFDLVTGQNRFPDNPVFLTPIELFHRLEASQPDQASLVRSVRFVPSYQRRLTRQLSGFDARKREAFAQLTDPAQAAAVLPAAIVADVGQPTEQAELVDAALSFWEARILAEKERNPVAERVAKDRLLKLRLRLPVLDDAPQQCQTDGHCRGDLPPPSRSNHVMAVGVGPAHGQSRHFLGGQTGLSVHVTPYKQDDLSFHHIPNFGQLRVLDARLIADGQGRVQLERLEVFKVNSVASADITGLDSFFSRHFSWALDTGFKQVVSAYPELLLDYQTDGMRLSLAVDRQAVRDRSVVGLPAHSTGVQLSFAHAIGSQHNVIVSVENRSGHLATGVGSLRFEARF
jgi:hypothetical protein